MKVKYLVWVAAGCLLALALALSFARGEIRTGMSIRAVAQDSTDADGDNIRYEFDWEMELPDGTLVDITEYDSVSDWIAPAYDQAAESVIPPNVIKKREVWRVRVRACDADGDCSEYQTAEATVGGVPPTVPGVSIEPVP